MPNRRPSIVVDLEHDGIGYTASIGLDHHGRPAEIFCRASKPDSAMDLLSDDASVVLSITLQSGITPAQLQHSIGRLHGQPASLIGRLVDLIAAHAA